MGAFVHRYYVYIMASKKDGVLYTGVTNDIARRDYEHKEAKMEGFTKEYFARKLVYVERHQYIDKALAREKRIKRWKRDWKIRLIEKLNPDWKDLSKDIQNWI